MANNPPEDLRTLLNREAATGDVLTDWEVTTHPNGTTVKAHTRGAWPDMDDAMSAAADLFAAILGCGYAVGGGCSVGAVRDVGASDPWHGCVQVRLTQTTVG